MAPAYSLVFFLLSNIVILHSAGENCSPFDCGKLGKLKFPFSNTTPPSCGGWYTVNCSEAVQKVQLEKSGKWYAVENISQANIVTIRDEEFNKRLKSRKCETFNNLTLPISPFGSFKIIPNLTMYKCNSSLKSVPLSSYRNYTGCNIHHNFSIYYTPNDSLQLTLPPQCSIIQLPKNPNPRNNEIFSLLAADISLEVPIPMPNDTKGDQTTGRDTEKAGEEWCPTFDCGKFGTLRFPFSNTTPPSCGFYSVNCSEPVQKVQLEKSGKWYEVENISQANIVTIRDEEFNKRLKSRECETFNNLTLPISPFGSFKITPNLTMYKCNSSLKSVPHSSFRNYTGCNHYNFSIYYTPNDSLLLTPPPQCSIIQLPKNPYPINNEIFSLLAADISVEVPIPMPNDTKGGQTTGRDTEKGASGKLLIKGAIGASAAGMAVLIFILCLIRGKFMILWKKRSQNHQSVEDFLRNYGSLAPRRYSYSNIKKMTYSFKDKLGQGGYGGVYKGKLHDGRLVAVKVLNKSKGDGEEFVNEVASISRTAHVNIVTLLGFCFEDSKRALIYEFMPNGSLEKFIYDENLSRANRQLEWKTLYQIAIGIARGLEYLHCGCNTQILHFDIKPHNILLDEELRPKISDFGLAKLCPQKQSIISMSGARGTAGYIAPEVFFRHFGRVSHKSDVYSYGMMVLEMVGGRKNIDVGVDHTSEIYFPHWIYKRLEHGGALGLHGVMSEEDNEKAQKMILVGLWCIQTDPSNRPPIGRAVEMLQGSLGSLQIPPKPFLSSPPRSPADSSTTPTMTL